MRIQPLDNWVQGSIKARFSPLASRAAYPLVSLAFLKWTAYYFVEALRMDVDPKRSTYMQPGNLCQLLNADLRRQIEENGKYCKEAHLFRLFWRGSDFVGSMFSFDLHRGRRESHESMLRCRW